LQERCISHDILTNLDLDNNEVEESKSVAHFDDRSANNVSSRQHVESSRTGRTTVMASRNGGGQPVREGGGKEEVGWRERA